VNVTLESSASLSTAPQAEGLDEACEVPPDTEVSFVKLVPLLGG
jgi:hypothetical protein